MSGALVVLSGGLDSTVVLGLAVRSLDRVETVTFLYGQRHRREVQHAALVAQHYDVPHLVIELPDVLVGGALTGDTEMPHLTYEELEASQGPSPTYVPYRNGVMLSVAAAVALSHGIDEVHAGMHSEDAHHWAYPDCTPEFIGAQAAAMYIGSYHEVRLVTPLEWLTKTNVVAVGNSIDVPFHLTLSCYEGTVPACGVCPTCMGRVAAFEANALTDPVAYV